eukprot:563377-Pelagomonas_calceolata.AAC.5
MEGHALCPTPEQGQGGMKKGDSTGAAGVQAKLPKKSAGPQLFPEHAKPCSKNTPPSTRKTHSSALTMTFSSTPFSLDCRACSCRSCQAK